MTYSTKAVKEFRLSILDFNIYFTSTELILCWCLNENACFGQNRNSAPSTTPTQSVSLFDCCSLLGCIWPTICLIALLFLPSLPIRSMLLTARERGCVKGSRRESNPRKCQPKNDWNKELVPLRVCMAPSASHAFFFMWWRSVCEFHGIPVLQFSLSA